MQKIFFIAVTIVAGFAAESVLDVFFGPWGKPNFLLLIVVFFNLFRGIRYSLVAAFIAGFLQDSFGVNTFGINIFSLVLCAFLTTVLKWYFYRAGSGSFRVAMVFLISSANVAVHSFLYMMFSPFHPGEIFVHVFLPEVTVTTVATHFVFNFLKRCASRYSV